MKIADHHLAFLCTVVYIIISFWLDRTPTTDSTIIMIRTMTKNILIFLAAISFINWLKHLNWKKEE